MGASSRFSGAHVNNTLQFGNTTLPFDYTPPGGIWCFPPVSLEDMLNDGDLSIPARLVTAAPLTCLCWGAKTTD